MASEQAGNKAFRRGRAERPSGYPGEHRDIQIFSRMNAQVPGSTPGLDFRVNPGTQLKHESDKMALKGMGGFDS